MTKKIYVERILMLTLLLLPFITQQIEATEPIYLSYTESFVNGSSSPLKLPALSKKDRSNSHSSKIVATLNSEDDHVKKCLDYAISVWESSILNCDSIFFTVDMQDIDDDIITHVRYDQNGKTYIPTALNAYLAHQNREHSTPDGFIIINTNTKWDYSLGEDIPSDCKNLTFAFMRGIARIMGFGSSVSFDKDGNYIFGCRRGYSTFDELIYNSANVKLTSVRLNGGKANPELKDYIESGTQHFLVSLPDGKYELLPPPYSSGYPPFSFLNDKNSLMGGRLETGSYALQIDKNTKSILNAIGWNIDLNNPVKIVSDEVDDTGLTSAYLSHVFKIESEGKSIQNPKWELNLPLSNGEIETLSLKDNGLTCTTDPITDETQYIINQDGEIDAVLKFSCNIDGKLVHADPFKISFEVRPVIEYAVIEKIVDNSSLTSYDAYYRVKYSGATSILVSIDEEYSSRLRSKYIREPYIAHGVADHIKARYNAWIDITAYNDYGETVYTIALGPYGEVLSAGVESTSFTAANRHNETAQSKCLMIIDQENSYYEAYDIYGKKIGTFDTLNAIDNTGIRGIAVIRYIKNGNAVKTIRRLQR